MHLQHAEGTRQRLTHVMAAQIGAMPTVHTYPD